MAPNDTAYKRWICHSALKLLCKLCRTSSPLALGARFTFFWACRPCGPAGWLALLLTKAGDVETNPGPTTLNKKVWICDICHKQIHVRKQISIRCNKIEHWVHLRCAGIRQAQYTDTWTCHLHRESRLTPHTDITPPHRSRPWSKPPTHSPPTPPTPPQPKHRHMSNTPPVPTGLVKPKPNSLIHSPPSPPTPPRAKHIHMSNNPPTPLTSMSHVLDKTPEPRVPIIHALTPHPDPSPALPSPSHPHTLTAHTHATQTTVHASQSPQQPHAQHRVLRQPHSVLTGDVNAHSTLWHSYTDDHRGLLIADVISNSDHITLNTNTPTRGPNTTLQHTSSPDITTVSNTLYNRTSWTTQHALSSDHLPIITTINIRHDYRLQQNRRTFTNYKKADWTQFTEDTESAFAQTTIPTNIHTANRIFINIMLMADKQNIPKGRMHINCWLLPEDIVWKITQRNNIRRANTCDPALKLLNEEITSDIQKHKQNIWKEHLDAHWDHRHNTHTLWKTIMVYPTEHHHHTLNTSITFNNKIATTPKHIANCFTKQFTNTVKHATHKTNRHINRATHNIQGYNITLTTSRSKRL